MTNGDWIRSLTNEQIAALLANERWNLGKGKTCKISINSIIMHYIVNSFIVFLW